MSNKQVCVCDVINARNCPIHQGDYVEKFPKHLNKWSLLYWQIWFCGKPFSTLDTSEMTITNGYVYRGKVYVTKVEVL